MSSRPDDWSRVREAFEGALAFPADARSAYLSKTCGGDTALRQQVEALLASHERAKSFLETPAGARRDAVASLELATPHGAQEGEFARLEAGSTRGAGSPQALEIQVLLRHRLRIGVLIIFGAIAVFYAMRFLRLEFTSRIIWRTMVPGAAYLAVLAVLAAILWRKRIYTLSQLRSLEALLFGMTTLHFVGETYTPLFIEPGWLLAYVSRHASEMSILARQPRRTACRDHIRVWVLHRCSLSFSS